jgi:glutamine synthetase
MRTKDGKNVFALSDADAKKGRSDAANDDTKWMSQEGEWFLAGVLDGLSDSKFMSIIVLVHL